MVDGRDADDSDDGELLLRDASTNGSSEVGGVLLRTGTGDGVVMVAGNDVDDDVDDVDTLLRAVVGDVFIDDPMVAGKGADDVDNGTGSGFLGIS